MPNILEKGLFTDNRNNDLEQTIFTFMKLAILHKSLIFRGTFFIGYFFLDIYQYPLLLITSSMHDRNLVLKQFKHNIHIPFSISFPRYCSYSSVDHNIKLTTKFSRGLCILFLVVRNKPA